MQRNTLKRAKSLALAKRRVRNRRGRNPIIRSAWTAATTAYFGECPSWPTYLYQRSETHYGALPKSSHKNLLTVNTDCYGVVKGTKCLFLIKVISYFASDSTFFWFYSTNYHMLITPENEVTQTLQIIFWSIWWKSLLPHLHLGLIVATTVKHNLDNQVSISVLCF